MKINKHCFPNGLRLVHYEDTSTQMVALNIVYDVGARDEHPEHTGFAHLFEHLMFGGSAHIPDYDTPLQLAGGENNAWTNNDITNYYLTVPKPNVETAFWLESDRMLELAFSEQSLEVQRGVVMEEFKQRCLNQPYGDVGHLFRPLAFRVHPYRWPTIGKELSHIEQATLDEVKEAAKKADAHEFIRHLPLQYNTYLEEAGNGLSGGEKQRIALARAFLKDSNLYILDESTSNLDFATETLIFNMIYEQLADRSMLIVAHRLSTIRDCDLILVMDHGKIVERGNHEELMAKNGRYAELWNMQQGIFRKRKSEPAPQVPSAVVEEDDDGESITY